jgi:hypothetical protein
MSSPTCELSRPARGLQLPRIHVDTPIFGSTQSCNTSHTPTTANTIHHCIPLRLPIIASSLPASHDRTGSQASPDNGHLAVANMDQSGVIIPRGNQVRQTQIGQIKPVRPAQHEMFPQLTTPRSNDTEVVCEPDTVPPVYVAHASTRTLPASGSAALHLPLVQRVLLAVTDCPWPEERALNATLTTAPVSYANGASCISG